VILQEFELRLCHASEGSLEAGFDRRPEECSEGVAKLAVPTTTTDVATSFPISEDGPGVTSPSPAVLAVTRVK